MDISSTASHRRHTLSVAFHYKVVAHVCCHIASLSQTYTYRLSAAWLLTRVCDGGLPTKGAKQHGSRSCRTCMTDRCYPGGMRLGWMRRGCAAISDAESNSSSMVRCLFIARTSPPGGIGRPWRQRRSPGLRSCRLEGPCEPCRCRGSTRPCLPRQGPLR